MKNYNMLYTAHNFAFTHIVKHMCHRYAQAMKIIKKSYIYCCKACSSVTTFYIKRLDL